MDVARVRRGHRAPRRLRPRSPARRRGARDPGPLPIAAVTLFYAQDCSLCEEARGQLARLRTEAPFELAEVDITGVPALEATYREWLPVVEIDGERAFVYRIDETELLERLRR